MPAGAEGTSPGPGAVEAVKPVAEKMKPIVGAESAAAKPQVTLGGATVSELRRQSPHDALKSISAPKQPESAANVNKSQSPLGKFKDVIKSKLGYGKPLDTPAIDNLDLRRPPEGSPPSADSTSPKVEGPGEHANIAPIKALEGRRQAPPQREATSPAVDAKRAAQVQEIQKSAGTTDTAPQKPAETPAPAKASVDSGNAGTDAKANEEQVAAAVKRAQELHVDLGKDKNNAQELATALAENPAHAEAILNMMRVAQEQAPLIAQEMKKATGIDFDTKKIMQGLMKELTNQYAEKQTDKKEPDSKLMKLLKLLGKVLGYTLQSTAIGLKEEVKQELDGVTQKDVALAA